MHTHVFTMSDMSSAALADNRFAIAARLTKLHNKSRSSRRESYKRFSIFCFHEINLPYNFALLLLLLGEVTLCMFQCDIFLKFN